MLDAWSKHDPELESRLTNRVDVLADRLATLAGTVSATASALAARDGEIAALRRELSRGQASLETAMLELRRTGAATPDLAELRNAVAALSVERDARRGGNARDDVMPAQAEVLAERIDTLAKTVATTAAGLAGREGELATLRRSLDDRGAQLDAVAGELRRSFAALSAEVAGHDGGTSEGETDPGPGGARRRSRRGDRLARDARRRDCDPPRARRIVERGRHRRPHCAPRRRGVQARRRRPRSDPRRRRRTANAARGVRARADCRRGLPRRRCSNRRARPAPRLLEQSGGAASVAILPIAGEGRFRVELRALELRLEQAEEAARESREAVLTQLERLASRVEWRLQRLETPDRVAPPEQRAPARELGLVVPIRAEARGEG